MKWPTRCTTVPAPLRDRAVNGNVAHQSRECSRPVLRLSGELDIATAATVRAAVDQACRDASGEVMIDLSAVQFFDAVTLGIFAEANDRLNETGGRLTLLGLSPHQEKLLRICSLERLLAVAVRRSWGHPFVASQERPPR
jgi:anti-anti-sigma factor